MDNAADFADSGNGCLAGALNTANLLFNSLRCAGCLLGKVLTSLATTAKPLPASPARAASILPPDNGYRRDGLFSTVSG